MARGGEWILAQRKKIFHQNIPSAYYSYREKQVKKEMHRGGGRSNVENAAWACWALKMIN